MAHGQGGAEIASERSPTLTCNHEAPIVFHPTQDPISSDEVCHSLGANANATAAVAVAFQESEYGTAEYDVAGTQRADRPGHTTYLRSAMQVRRLTPRECERLQGFPDDYTQVPHRGKLAADGPRYKALGNSMAVPVMRWIGERIAMVDEIARASI